MRDWTLDLFLSAVQDFERAQYQILSSLQKTRQAFASNCIFPHLSDLVHLYGTLRTIVEKTEGFRDALPRRLKGVDLEAGEAVYERPELSSDQMEQVEELMHWALPRIQGAIEEGKTIFEFVEEHLRLAEVGIVPSYLQEGYLLVPDRQAGRLHILQYSLSIFTGADERYRSLKTAHVKSLDLSVVGPTPQSIKLALLEERRELPNPATYYFETDLDFPFEPTMLPVAKRKLMQHLAIEGGAA